MEHDSCKCRCITFKISADILLNQMVSLWYLITKWGATTRCCAFSNQPNHKWTRHVCLTEWEFSVNRAGLIVVLEWNLSNVWSQCRPFHFCVQRCGTLWPIVDPRVSHPSVHTSSTLFPLSLSLSSLCSSLCSCNWNSELWHILTDNSNGTSTLEGRGSSLEHWSRTCYIASPYPNHNHKRGETQLTLDQCLVVATSLFSVFCS